MIAIMARTMMKDVAMDTKLCSEVQDFLYLINFVFFSIQFSAIVDGIVNNKLFAIISILLEFIVI